MGSVSLEQSRTIANQPAENENAASPAGSTAFRFRLAARRDLGRCAELLPRGFRAPAAVMQQIVGLWDRLLESEGRTFCVVENLEEQHPENIEGFGLSIFVTDRFFEEFRAEPRPYLAAQCYERMLAGDPIVMNAQQVSTANATSGLNVVVLHFGLSNEDLSNARTAQVLLAGTAGFFFFHAGYRIKVLANEVYGGQSAEYMQRGGFRLIRDFQRESPQAFAQVAPAHYPYLVQLRQEWVQPAVIDPMSQLFLHRPARIGFARSERRVLEGALLNESDAQIAMRLGVSLDSVKKTWRNIYARTAQQVPNLIPLGDRETAGSRGQEKRRHLLEYVRLHLEELRPNGKSPASEPRPGLISGA